MPRRATTREPAASSPKFSLSNGITFRLAWLLHSCNWRIRNTKTPGAMRRKSWLDKTNTEASLVQSAALWGVSRYREADERLRNLEKAVPKSAAILFQIASAYLGRKEFGPAEEVFRKMHQVDPADPRGLIGVKE